VVERLPADATVLDFGAGRGAAFSDKRPVAAELVRLAPKVKHRIGVDVDPVVLQNPAVQEAHVLTDKNGYRIPLPDSSVDAVVADWVLEHLPDPLSSFIECRRVLKPGGLFAARTPNRWHYTSIISRVFGSRGFGRVLLRIAQPERRIDDIFETHYGANSARTLRKLLKAAGFSRVEVLTHEAEPSYLMFSRPTLLLGWAYGRLAQKGLLPRASLFTFARV
jgi:SAM-dependent methyltransferase